MKIKKVTIIALILIVAGLLTCIVSFGFGFRFDKIENNKHTENKTFDLSDQNDNIKNLDIDLDACHFYIIKGENFNIDIKNSIENTVTHEVNGDTLKVEQKLKHKANIVLFGWNFGNGRGFDKTVITLTIPKNYTFDNVKIDVDVVKMDIDALKTKDLTIKNGVGSSTLNNIEADKAKIESDVGSVDINVSNLNDTDIESNVGSIKYNGELTGDCSISSDVGSVIVNLDGSLSDYSFRGHSGVGSIKINGNKLSDINQSGGNTKIKLDSSVGSIKINTKE